MNRILLIALLLTSVSHAQWSTDPSNNLIVGFGLLPELASDSAGGCYITYEQNLSYPRHLILERLNRYGYKPWGSSRQILGEFPEQFTAKLAEDGYSGVIVAYSDRWADSIFSPRVRKRVQRIDSSGNFLWGSTGMRVSISEAVTGDHAVVNDGAGGCIVPWVEVDTISKQSHLRINRINGAGVRVWGDSGKFVWNYGFQSPERPLIAADGRGGCYVRFGGDRLQRYDSQGNTYWSSPVQVPTSGRILRVDNTANVYLFGGKFLGIRNGQLLFTINLQKVDTSGTLLWDSLGVTLDTLNTNLFLNYDFSTRSGYSTVAWPQQIASQWDLRTQIVRSDGSTIFPFGGTPVGRTSSQKVIIGVLPSDSTTSTFVWFDNRAPVGTYAQKLDTLGEQQWDTSDVVVSFSQPSNVVTDGNGGFIAIVGGQNFAVRAQQVNKYGQLGQVITSVLEKIGREFPGYPVLYQNYPNPFNPQTTIRFQLPRAVQINLTLYNILGQNIKTLASGIREAGVHSVILEADNLPSGMYLYRLTTPEAVLTHKLIIIK
jgi:hypothetical protein